MYHLSDKLKVLPLLFSLLMISACNGGSQNIAKPATNPDSANQASAAELSISASAVFPVSLAHKTSYSLLLSNNSSETLKLDGSEFLLSSFDESVELNELISTTACQELAAKSNCVLTVSLPATSTSNGYLDFRLNYLNTRTNKLQTVNKLIKFTNQYEVSAGMVVVPDQGSIVAASKDDKATLAIPFILEQDFSMIKLELNGQTPKGYSEIRCDHSGYQAQTSCTALVAVDSADIAPEINLITTNIKNEQQSHRAAYNLFFAHAAHLSYLLKDGVLEYPLENRSAEVLVINDGLVAATGMMFEANATDFFLLSGTPPVNENELYSCLLLNGRLYSGRGCKLLYSKDDKLDSTKPSRAEQKISYNNGVTNMPVKDSFMIYRTLKNYISTEQKEIPSLYLRADGYTGGFQFKVNLFGDQSTTVTPQLDTSNPFGFISMQIEPKFCQLNTAKRSCEFTVSSFILSNAVANLTDFFNLSGVINANASNGVPVVGKHVFYKAQRTLPTIILPAEKPSVKKGVGEKPSVDEWGASWSNQGNNGATTLKGQRFKTEGDCIIDNLTGLTWTKGQSVQGGKLYENFLTTFTTLRNRMLLDNRICGHKDWRMPTVNELSTLINFDLLWYSYNGIWLEENGFELMNKSNFNGETVFWTSTVYEALSSNSGVKLPDIVVVDLGSGSIYKNEREKDLRVLYVRGGTSNDSNMLRE